MNNNFTNSYQIPGCSNTARESNIQYCPNFSENYEKFKTQIKSLVQNNESKTFYKFSDGEYLFAKGISAGSTSKGKRDTNIGCDGLDLTPFSEGIFKNDYYMAEHYEQSLNEFNNFFKGKNLTPIPAEYAYGLVSNKWFFKTFKGQIGLIGAKEKLELIQELLEYKEYRDYLGIDKFEDYIIIPQQID